MSCENLFRQRLRERGLRLTPQRELVLAVMHQLEAPATAEEIYTRVKAVNRGVDISTVYRTLELLREFRLVEVFDTGGIRKYEHLGLEPPHHHLVCRRCGKSIAIPMEALQELADRLERQYGFALTDEGLTLLGLCATCREANAPS